MTKIHNAYPINRTEAKELAALLRDAGYSSVSQKRCNDYACNVVRFYAGADPGAQSQVNDMIRQACGYFDDER